MKSIFGFLSIRSTTPLHVRLNYVEQNHVGAEERRVEVQFSKARETDNETDWSLQNEYKTSKVLNIVLPFHHFSRYYNRGSIEGPE